MTSSASFIVVEVAPVPPALDGPAALRLPAGAKLTEAVTRLGLEIPDACQVGVWGRKTTPDSCLEEGDRIEFYRPLVADPKTARRSRLRSARR